MDFLKRLLTLTTTTADRCDAAGARIVTAWERMATDAEQAADRHHAALNGTNGRTALPEASEKKGKVK